MAKTPTQERLVVVGAIAGAHGVRGDVRVKSFTEEPDALFTYGPLISETGEPLLEALKIRPGKDHFIVTPKRPREKEDWDALKGTRLHVPRSVLPPPEPDEFYVDDLVGLSTRAARPSARSNRCRISARATCWKSRPARPAHRPGSYRSHWMTFRRSTLKPHVSPFEMLPTGPIKATRAKTERAVKAAPCPPRGPEDRIPAYGSASAD